MADVVVEVTGIGIMCEKDFRFLKRIEISIIEMLDEFKYFDNSLKTINRVFEVRKIHK